MVKNKDKEEGLNGILVFSVICPFFLVFTVKLTIFFMFTVLEKILFSV